MPDTMMHSISSNKARMIDVQMGKDAVEFVTCPYWEAVTEKSRFQLIHLMWSQINSSKRTTYSLYCSELSSISIVNVITHLWLSQSPLTRLMSCVHSWNYSPPPKVQFCTSLLQNVTQGHSCLHQVPLLFMTNGLFNKWPHLPVTEFALSLGNSSMLHPVC